MTITDIDTTVAESLPRRTMILYGLPHLTDAVMTLPMALFIPAFYAGEMGLPLAGVGAMISISRIFDVLIDPVIGTLSDRWHSRWGRRKPWLVVGTPIIMLATWMLFVPPADVSLLYLMIWASLLSIGYSLFDLPYKAWGAELSTDYRERSRIAAWREGFGAAGQFLFLAVLIVMGIAGHKGGSNEMRAIALMVIVSLPPLVAITLWRVPERLPERLTGEVLIGWSAMISLFKNRAFLRTVLAIILFGAGLMIQATLHKLVLTHVIGRPELFAPLILGETVASLAAMPLWLKLSDRIGKHRAVTLAALWVGVWSLPFPWVGAGDIELYSILIALRGSSFAAIFFLSNSIAADVIDQDTLDTGKQRTGLFFALWGMAIKLAVALGVLIGTGFPALFGFVPTTASHTPSSISALMHIYGWLPGLIMLLAFPLLWNFPIDEAYHQLLRGRIEARRSP
ncbi:MFS transporter [Methylomicrobium sp. Wu6]|uniref:MFS transporter n=1 Tax=Methylomicrobium sp. Wu6 TaxID=3107928 RepID=UPI002DD61D9B|nr:MFS transporter [Methylomicrobium sp. Wu6]MEC4750163.1 MFS transporter [Methylomicrobium sp. Wu6]